MSQDGPSFHLRFNGIAADSVAAAPISLSDPVTASRLSDRPTVGHRVRMLMRALRDPGAGSALRSRLSGQSFWAGVTTLDEEPVFIGPDGTLNQSAPADRLAISCGIKLVTASAMIDHVGSGAFSLQTSVKDVLGVESLQGIPAENLVVKDLLNHRHGLDEHGLWAASFMGDGWVDERALLLALGAGVARSSPGWRYSYSKVGYWLVGAMLQRLEGRSFGQILASQGLEVAGNVCPAMGGSCWFSQEELLRFLLERMRRGRERGSGLLPPSDANTLALPGWAPYERGMQYGWKVFPEGWVGHNAQLPTQTGVIRVHPESGTALFMWVDRDKAAPILSKLFGNLLPECAPIYIPKVLPREQWLATNPSRYFGQFRAEGRVLTIDRVNAKGIAAVMRMEGRRDRFRGSDLRFNAADREVFFAADQKKNRNTPFIQFLSAPSGEVDAVWTGRKVWPKIGVTATPMYASSQ